jgi:acetyl esterase
MSPHLRRRSPLRATLVVACLTALGAAGATIAQGERLAPTAADVPYGSHPRQVLDFWKARPGAGKPTPVVIFFHGGGFMGGDKRSVPSALLKRCLDAGISVVSANYRLSHQAPYPAPMLDGARAVQFVRSKADSWGLDPGRMAAAGDSAGAGIALWVGLHDDLADPASRDPVDRRSTRLAALGTVGAQTSYDPRFIRSMIGGRAHEHPALAPFFGLTADALDSALAHALYESASPINYASSDDPPVFLYYAEPDRPIPADAPPGQGIHHPRFGAALKARLDPLGVPCVVRHHDHYKADLDPYDAQFTDMVAFFRRVFDAR